MRYKIQYHSLGSQTIKAFEAEEEGLTCMRHLRISNTSEAIF